MRRRLHRIGLSLLLTVGVIAWNQQQNQSFAHLPISANTRVADGDRQSPERVISDLEIRALLRVARPLRLLKRD